MKKSIVFLLFLGLGLSFAHAQSDSRPPECRKATLGLPAGTTENFEVSFYTDLYGTQFKSNDRCLTPELKKQIRSFLTQPYGPGRRFELGHNVMQVLKVRGAYYVYMPDSRPQLKPL